MLPCKDNPLFLSIEGLCAMFANDLTCFAVLPLWEYIVIFFHNDVVYFLLLEAVALSDVSYDTNKSRLRKKDGYLHPSHHRSKPIFNTSLLWYSLIYEYYLQRLIIVEPIKLVLCLRISYLDASYQFFPFYIYSLSL